MKSGALKIAIIYVVAGVSWVALSDKVLDLLKARLDVSVILFIGSIKGVGYMIFTGFILYRLILHYNAKLDESEKQYRSYFEANPSPMWIYNKRTLNFTAVNNAAISKYGYTADEFMNMTILDIRPKSDVGKVHTVVKQLAGTYNDSGIWTHRKKDGTLIPVHITSHIITSLKEPHIMVMAAEVKKA
ncbi:PAS domain S-box protein [Mucilaginibacter sp. dw_454]|uniref:PAS domain S-box protein n=1 Tax=Mucilaginibacter sp. dw_454 TaxID=2720079 RepID=UPI001BD6D8FF|nr:PAS domain S-box protein [Mucilaginibacter sp. dw_454]